MLEGGPGSHVHASCEHAIESVWLQWLPKFNNWMHAEPPRPKIFEPLRVDHWIKSTLFISFVSIILYVCVYVHFLYMFCCYLHTFLSSCTLHILMSFLCFPSWLLLFQHVFVFRIWGSPQLAIWIRTHHTRKVKVNKTVSHLHCFWQVFCITFQ